MRRLKPGEVVVIIDDTDIPMAIGQLFTTDNYDEDFNSYDVKENGYYCFYEGEYIVLADILNRRVL